MAFTLLQLVLVTNLALIGISSTKDYPGVAAK
jgi:hypothetical protein